MNVQQFKAAEKVPLVVVLDNIRSQHNVGSIFRTADAFRLQGLCLCGLTGCPPSAEMHKTALGAEDAVAFLKSGGFTVLAVEQVEGSCPLTDVSVVTGQPCALVMGHEVMGVSQAVVDACDGAVEIPQYGTKHSLNVSVSAGIVMWEFARRIGFAR